ncbi:TPA: LSM domain protein [Staphylococcus delphini]|uniref:LSM domain protein n=1 Tax=Staphylococcus delphini TaxID=53344 RepID=UPI000BBCB1E5|nr:LSM domain protein [Staphylococcus delphini]PCF45321.1 LSM domain protein [Staphylococcus delphini]PCF72936.1 LSM domain protein [Staphylococcus delphini]HEC2156208.1 LSM domain protein [Staphylococcus delphini]HEC2176257.1 LSM domain protein [Staphylococcus delphini]
MKLWTYVGKNVRIELKNGVTFTGYAFGYDDEIDNESGEDFIYLDIGMETLLCFNESRIKSIEVLD